MGDFNENLKEENQYLEITVSLLKELVETSLKALTLRKDKLLKTRKDMWENSSHSVRDFSKLTEVNQYLSEVANHTAEYENTRKQVENYRNMIDSPYFGRFDFIEDGYEQTEKIYIGIHNLIDPKSSNIYVYDWRAPISSIFYRYDTGKASFTAPSGLISGQVSLKRQYKIQNSSLKYFFDCNVRISDDILQQVLSRNASPKMRSIVETIQKEQDIIIRDIDSELLIVQGTAGSGKTSIAMHRIAFLLYEGLESKLGSDNIIIISPNDIFSTYISSVLPELGEENVRQITLSEIFETIFKSKAAVETRNVQMEALISGSIDEREFRRKAIEFKGSEAFVGILDSLVWYFEHRLIKFEDIFYNGIIVENRQQLKNSFLQNKIGEPASKRLERIERKIWEKIVPLQKKRLSTLENAVQKGDRHQFEIKSYSRLLSIKETKTIKEKLRKFTMVDPFKLYKLLFSQPGLLYRLAGNMRLPENIERIISETGKNLQNGLITYEDCGPLLYLKLKLEGSSIFKEIRQVLVDEAQDYYPVQYEVLNLLFKNARFTILGDINQSIERQADYSMYEGITRIFDRSKTEKLILKRGYRSSFEISSFASKLLPEGQSAVPFERHEEPPEIVGFKNDILMNKAVIEKVDNFRSQGYESIAIICKTRHQSEELYGYLREHMDVDHFDTHNRDFAKAVLVMPVYMAKGLEFDAVIVYNAEEYGYRDVYDRRLMYIACTRALHRLSVLYSGEISPLLR
ncbi:MAG: AAA family ATPase [Bacillota bacterium]|nr:AAA family ATPase [Bacillota bacterium]